MKVPIACTLTASAAEDRIEEWRVALSTSVTAPARPLPARVELRLVNDPRRIAALIDLAQREKACCGFFDFTIEIDAETVTMVVAVPEEAVAALEDFAALVNAG